MKNRVLRLAVVAMLVVAMTLTMAACAAPAAPVVEAPKAPQAPAAAPVEDVKAPVVAPAPVEDTVVDAPAAPSAEDALKADYGITIEAKGKTYDAAVGGSKGGTIKVKLPENGFSLTEDAARYYVSYKIEAIDYEGLGTKPVKNSSVADSYDAVLDANGLSFKDAGVYTVEITVSVLDQGVDFGFFGIPEAEDADEYTITKTVEVSKKAVTISIADTYEKVSTGKVNAAIGAANAGLTYSDAAAEAALVAAMGTKGALYIVTPAYDKANAGVITKTIAYAKKAGYADEDDLLDFSEVEVANYTYTLGTGTINILSSYEWNEVGDVLTSVLDIPAADTTAKIAALDQYALALKRYEALTDSQVVFLKNIADITDVDDGSGTNDDGFASTVEFGTGKAYTTTITDAAKGSTLVKWLAEDIKKAYDAAELAKANKKAWDDVVKAAEWDKYGVGFNVNNEFAMASFNVIDAFVKGNAATIKALGFVNDSGAFVTGVNDEFDDYVAAIAKISEAKINATKELIKGAEAAYIKAKAHADANPDLLLYKNAADLYYIDNEEVDLLVKYALDAYNALTKAEQDAVDSDTSSATIKDLAQMSKVVDSMKEITEYVKIANYAKKESDIYATLRKLVYGVNMTTADFFGNTVDADKHYALADLDKYFSDDEVRAAVVAEYKAWIDVVVAFEAVKEAAVDAFDVAFDEYCADKELSNTVIAGSKYGYDGIVEAIMNGETSVDATDLNGIKYPTVKSILDKKPETVEEAKEYFEDAFDGERIAKNLTYDGTAWSIVDSTP